jgi:signal transduction histidine kinase/ligand-binding sensor domain-containing protein/AraC-like DNA-binding protein
MKTKRADKRPGQFILLLLSCFLVCHLPCSAQTISSDLELIHYDVKDGLSQSTVLAIYQDKYGFLWLGTRDGLNRFDGYSFEIFQHEPEDTTTIGDNYINDITGDPEGNLWIGTSNGLSYYDKNTRKFENFIVPHFQKDAEVSCVIYNPKGFIWVGTKDGLFHFDPYKKRFYQPTEYPVLREIGSKYVLSVLEDKDRNIWVGTTQGIFFQDSRTGQVSVFNHQLKGKYHITQSRIEKLVQDSTGKIWAGSYGGGLQCIDPEEGFVFSLQTSSDPSLALSNNFIRDLFIDNNNRLWIGTFDGLNIYDIADHSTVRISYDPEKAIGLSHNSIRSIAGLKDGSVCIGTYFGGLNYFNVYNQKFVHLQNIPEDPSSLSYNVISCFDRKDSIHMWVGTERGGLNLLNTRNQQFRKYPFNEGEQSLSSHTIKSLYFDQNNKNLWIGTFKGGLNLYEPEINRFSRFPSSENPGFSFLSNCIVNDIKKDSDGYLWIATDRYGGLFKFDVIKQRFIHFQLEDSIHGMLENTNVKSIMIDKIGNIWLSTYGKGILVFNEKENYLFEIGTTASSFLAINKNDVNYVFEDRNGIIWIATNGGGINRIDRKTNKITHLTTLDGLLSNMILGLTQDKEGNIWIAAANGLSRYDPGTHTIRNYSHTSGVPLEEISTPPYFFDQADQLFLGGNNGMMLFFPSKLLDNESIPEIKITGLRLFNEPVVPGDESGILEHSILDTRKIVLNHSQSIFTIEFTALNYLFPLQNRYRYKLEGLETEWNEVRNQRIATYTNLKEGSYRFLVMGSNNDDVWNPEPAELEIVVLPPNWKSWWASLIYLFLIFSGIFGLRQMVLHRTRLKNELSLKELENQKLEEMHQLKMQFFTDVSHEIQTPLTLILDPLEQLNQSGEGTDWQKSLLKTIHVNTRRLNLLINQIIELNQIEHGKLKIKYTPERLNDLLRDIVDSFRLLADKSNIRLSFETTLPDEHYRLDRDKMEKILYNLLSNAFKFNKVGGSVDVVAHPLDNSNNEKLKVELLVRDTGKGIDKDKLDRIFDRFYKAEYTSKGSGIGLSLVKSLVETMGGSIQVRSEPFLGSTFSVILEFQPATGDEEIVPSRTGEYSKPLPVEYYFSVEDNGEESLLDPGRNKNPTLLLIDDDKELLNYMLMQLKDSFEIIAAGNGIDGIEKANKYNPDLIITDIRLPGMDGIEVCRDIKSNLKTSHIPVIILTAMRGDEDRLAGLESGADAFMVKPFFMKEIRSRINNILNTRKQLREKYSRQFYLSPGEITLNSYDEKLMQKIMKVIEKYIGEPSLTVDFLGEKVGLSRVHLYRKLKALTDMSPSEFIKSIRMKRAADILAKDKVSITEAGYMVGFQDLNYFSKTFRKTYGCSPSEYAERSKQKE